MTSRRIAGLTAAVVVAVSLAGCSSSNDAGASATPSPTPTPTPASVVWAGDVCVAFADVKLAVGALGHNLSYDVTKDASALDQINKQIRLQVLSIADSAEGLQSTLQEVPVDFVEANAMVESITKAGGDTKEAVNAVTVHLDAAQQAGNVVTGAAEIAQAVVAAKAAFEAGQALVGVIGDATSQASGKLKESFDAAPQCQVS
jgi:methyl-accepting chemotaxis protein